MLKVLICGDRTWKEVAPIRAQLERLLDGREAHELLVIHGAAAGADSIAGTEALKMRMSVRAFPAQWRRWGRAAGPIRNQQMLNEGQPDMVLAFHRDITRSKGTADMVRKAVTNGLWVRVFNEMGEEYQSHNEGVLQQ